MSHGQSTSKGCIIKSERRNDFWFRFNEIICFIIDSGIAFPSWKTAHRGIVRYSVLHTAGEVQQQREKKEGNWKEIRKEERKNERKKKEGKT